MHPEPRTPQDVCGWEDSSVEDDSLSSCSGSAGRSEGEYGGVDGDLSPNSRFAGLRVVLPLRLASHCCI
jgi:hypothetical protein